MESTQAIQSREEKTAEQFTERQLNLAKKYNVKPEAVKRLDTGALEWVEDAIKESLEFWPKQGGEIKLDEWTGDKKIANSFSNAVKTNHEVIEERTGFDYLIEISTIEDLAAAYAAIQITRNNPAIAEKLAKILEKELEWMWTTNIHDEAAKRHIEMETNVLSCLSWINFARGISSAKNVNIEYYDNDANAETLVKQIYNQESEINNQAESKGDPSLKTIKRFLDNVTYKSKLVAVLVAEFFNKESEFQEPDNQIGNDYYNKWKDEIIANANNPEYIEKCESKEDLALSMAVNMLSQWQA